MRTTQAAALLAAVAAILGGAAAAASQAPRANPRPQAAQPEAFDSSRAWEHLRRQVGFGPRPSGSDALAQTRQYILQQLKAAGIEAREQPFTAKTPAGDIAMRNVIATVPGRRRDRIILASHYDTKRAPFRFVGANDGASSTAALLEIGRVLKTRRNDFTIELLFLDGEEAVNWDWGTTGVDNTYGSRHYVEDARAAGTLASAKALVLLDMIGERDVMVRREAQSTRWLVDIIWNTARQLGHARTFSSETMAVDDDHIAFLHAGVPAADVIDLDFPQWHTAQDDLDRVSAGSLQVVGDVVLASLAPMQTRLASAPSR